MPHLHHADLGSSHSLSLTLILVFTAVVYLKGWSSLRSNFVKTASVWRMFSFLIGLFLIWIAVASPISALDHELLTVHMLQHLLLMTLAPPLIWLGAPVRPMLRVWPKRFIEALLPALEQPPAAKKFVEVVGRPKFALLAACAALVGWHIPTFFTLGMQSAGWHLLEHLSFFATGLLFWWPVVQSSEGTPRQDFSLILYLFLATLPCDILSGFLVFSERVVYPMYFTSSHLLGFSPLVDQQCAAALMWTCVTVVYLIAGAILTMRLLSPHALSQVGVAEPKLQATEIGHRVAQSMEAI